MARPIRLLCGHARLSSLAAAGGPLHPLVRLLRGRAPLSSLAAARWASPPTRSALARPCSAQLSRCSRWASSPTCSALAWPCSAKLPRCHKGGPLHLLFLSCTAVLRSRTLLKVTHFHEGGSAPLPARPALLIKSLCTNSATSLRASAPSYPSHILHGLSLKVFTPGGWRRDFDLPPSLLVPGPDPVAALPWRSFTATPSIIASSDA